MFKKEIENEVKNLNELEEFKDYNSSWYSLIKDTSKILNKDNILLNGSKDLFVLRAIKTKKELNYLVGIPITIALLSIIGWSFFPISVMGITTIIMVFILIGIIEGDITSMFVKKEIEEIKKREIDLLNLLKNQPNIFRNLLSEYKHLEKSDLLNLAEAVANNQSSTLDNIIYKLLVQIKNSKQKETIESYFDSESINDDKETTNKLKEKMIGVI